jgi:hypothetical protein
LGYHRITYLVEPTELQRHEPVSNCSNGLLLRGVVRAMLDHLGHPQKPVRHALKLAPGDATLEGVVGEPCSSYHMNHTNSSPSGFEMAYSSHRVCSPTFANGSSKTLPKPPSSPCGHPLLMSVLNLLFVHVKARLLKRSLSDTLLLRLSRGRT